ncbi:PLP-dependent aminotransferase family protein [Clostridiaceae bacterium UIB06]|uniref:PLP-dependent aminotransferase family protein n=1 Tax=Clostridium thailandense TaxID=2794346 RepID=A0A949TXG1_9CLOT|nr:PLP-dependent aminotransferase family protein [Clostridium thailandense]MBV7272698.1 PLP-dependent aminotransferase family protein [Clostridium thailandense]MCH5137867.1 PLP-dependent aminotransferase family protein [Clostridiaceae bacterium UIB06]
MKNKFAKRLSTGGSSEADEIIALIMKLTEMPEVISFAGGLPDGELFPVEEMKSITHKILSEDGNNALQYSGTQGLKELRQSIAEQIMKDAGVEATADNIMITCGSQQGLEFSGRIFLDEGDVVICESPSYVGAITAFQPYGPKFVEVKMDQDGMIMEELEEALKNNPNTKFIYTVPDFQNPTGITMTVERRKRLVELARKYDVLILEDNPYGNLIFEGERLPAIKSFDTDDRVIYHGTFSKIFCPGLRIGWLCTTKEFLDQYLVVKQSVDLQTNTMAQKETALYMKMFDLKANVNKIIDVYRRRKDLMLKTMKEEFPENCSFTHPKGGLFLWVTLPEDKDSSEVLKKAMEMRVGFVPGIAFYPNGNHRNNFRLNFSSMKDEQIVEGIKRLGKVLKSL